MREVRVRVREVQLSYAIADNHGRSTIEEEGALLDNNRLATENWQGTLISWTGRWTLGPEDSASVFGTKAPSQTKKNQQLVGQKETVFSNSLQPQVKQQQH